MTEQQYTHTVIKPASVVSLSTGEEYSMQQFREINQQYADLLGGSHFAHKDMQSLTGANGIEAHQEAARKHYHGLMEGEIMDSLFYQFNELKFGGADLTKDELQKLSGAELNSLVGFRRGLFKVVSVKPLELLLVQNVGLNAQTPNTTSH